MRANSSSGRRSRKRSATLEPRPSTDSKLPGKARMRPSRADSSSRGVMGRSPRPWNSFMNSATAGPVTSARTDDDARIGPTPSRALKPALAP
ncbi:MAG: hypothetical protein ABW123_25765 [Cystobacter sp.]